MTGALQKIAKPSTFKENQHFINEITILKAKDHQSFYNLLAQVDKVVTLI